MRQDHPMTPGVIDARQQNEPNHPARRADDADHSEQTLDMAQTDIIKRLRIKAGMIQMGERIAWSSDSDLMYEAADVIEQLMARDEEQYTPAAPAAQPAAEQSAPGEVERPVAFVKYDSPIKGHTEFMRYEPWMDDGLSTGWIPLYSSQLAAHQKREEGK